MRSATLLPFRYEVSATRAGRSAARAAREAGAPWLGVATIEEAVRLREAGDTGRLLCWLTVPGDDWAAAIKRSRVAFPFRPFGSTRAGARVGLGGGTSGV